MADTVVEIIEQPTRVRVEGGELIIEATQGILRVADALDVDLAGRVDGDVLTWDSATSKYVHDPAAGGGATTLAALTDVSGGPPASGEAPVWDGDSFELTNVATQTELDALAGTVATDVELAAGISALAAASVLDGDAAGGVLSGTYPNPGFAVDMATQAELDAAVAAEASARTTADGLLVAKSLYDANTVLAADTDDTPAALTMGASTILARLAAGNIKAATPAELRTLLDVPTTGEAILDAIVDAKGDLIAATAADTVARLPVGANGKVLRADSNLTLGSGWVDPLVPYAGWMPVSSAGKIESLPRYALASASLAPTTGTLYLIALPLPLLAGVTYSSISMVSQGAASVPLNQWFCLVKKSDLTLLRSTTDDTTTAWGASTLKTLNLSSTYTPTADTLAYVGFMILATTPNTFRSVALQTVVTNLPPILVGTSNAAMTSPLADGTALAAMTGTASAFYAVVG